VELRRCRSVRRPIRAPRRRSSSPTHQITAQRLATPHLRVKAISVDGERAYVGSENFSYASLSENREIGLVMTEAGGLTAIADAFSTDWAQSSVF
jgi:phosphatidylserine/phosphatidylglycerophosphate/cardiolipin synthase-like enzyme